MRTWTQVRSGTPEARIIVQLGLVFWYTKRTKLKTNTPNAARGWFGVVHTPP